MVVHGQLVEPAVCLSDLYDDFLLDIVRDTRQSLFTILVVCIVIYANKILFKLINDHFDLYLTPVTLTFNLPEKIFQMALLLLEDNNCAKLFLKSMHKYTSYGPDKLNMWPF